MSLSIIRKLHDETWRKFDDNPKLAAAATFGLAATIATTPIPYFPEIVRALIVGANVAVGTLYLVEAIGQRSSLSDAAEGTDLTPHRSDIRRLVQAHSINPREN